MNQPKSAFERAERRTLWRRRRRDLAWILAYVVGIVVLLSSSKQLVTHLQDPRTAVSAGLLAIVVWWALKAAQHLIRLMEPMPMVVGSVQMDDQVGEIILMTDGTQRVKVRSVMHAVAACDNSNDLHALRSGDTSHEDLEHELEGTAERS